jgi:hypothetical protein
MSTENSHFPQPEILPRSDNTEAIASEATYSLPYLPTLLRVFHSDAEPVFESQSALAPASITAAASELVAFFSEKGRLKSLKDAAHLPPADCPGFTVAPEPDSRPLPHSQLWHMGFDTDAVHRALSDAEIRAIESISRDQGDADDDAVQRAFSDAENRAFEILIQEHQGDVGGGGRAVAYASREMPLPALDPSRAPAHTVNTETRETLPHHLFTASTAAAAAHVPRDRPQIWHGSYRDAVARATAPLPVPAASTAFPSSNVAAPTVSPVTAVAAADSALALDEVTDDGEKVNINLVIYMRVALPLQHHSDPYYIWSRFLRIALYFHYVTSTESQTKVALLEALERVHSWAMWASCIKLLSKPPLQPHQPQPLSTAQQHATETHITSPSFVISPDSTTQVFPSISHGSPSSPPLSLQGFESASLNPCSTSQSAFPSGPGRAQTVFKQQTRSAPSAALHVPAAHARNRNHLVAMLTQATPEQQKQILGEALYLRIIRSQPELAGKITGMLLEGLDTAVLLSLIDSPVALQDHIMQVLEALQGRSKASLDPRSAAQSALPSSAAGSPSEHHSEQHVIGFDNKDFVSSAFQALREHFPEDRRFFDFELSKMCEWLDFQRVSWSDPHITVPVHGVHILDGAGSVHTEEADRFLSHPTINPFSVIEAFILPPRFSTDACSSIRRALSSRMRIPSVQFACGDCSVVAVLSSIDVPSLRLSSACSLLPLVGPRMSEPLVCAILCMCRQALVKEESSSVLLQNEATSVSLLAALQRCLEIDAPTPSSTGPSSLVEIDALDQTGHWYHAFIVDGTVNTSNSILVHFMVHFLNSYPKPPTRCKS